MVKKPLLPLLPAVCRDRFKQNGGRCIYSCWCAEGHAQSDPLTYDPASDQLKGIYYQPAEKQRFEVALCE